MTLPGTDAVGGLPGAPVVPDEPFPESVHRQGGRGPRAAVDEAAMVEALAAAYPLGRWRSWRPTELGSSNESWFVETDAGSVVLRRSHPLKTVAGARFECALLDVLRRHGYPAPEVLHTRDGGTTVELDGALHMVMRRLPGTGYDPASPGHLAAAARGLARYHAIVSELTVPGSADPSFLVARLGPAGQAGLAAAVDVVAPQLGTDTRETMRERARSLAGAMEQVHRELGAVQDRLTTVVGHGSYGPSALLLVEDRLSGVVDFDRAAYDLLGLDLAYALDAFCRPGAVRRAGVGLDLRLTREFLHHYRAGSPVVDADLGFLPHLLRAQRLEKVLKKCDNVLTMQLVAPGRPKNVDRFARMLEAECVRVQWLEQDPVQHLTQDLPRELPHDLATTTEDP
ncbi:phosphotransferase [Modestobacter sp. URMC 112]